MGTIYSIFRHQKTFIGMFQNSRGTVGFSRWGSLMLKEELSQNWRLNWIYENRFFKWSFAFRWLLLDHKNASCGQSSSKTDEILSSRELSCILENIGFSCHDQKLENIHSGTLLKFKPNPRIQYFSDYPNPNRFYIFRKLEPFFSFLENPSLFSFFDRTQEPNLNHFRKVRISGHHSFFDDVTQKQWFLNEIFMFCLFFCVTSFAWTATYNYHPRWATMKNTYTFWVLFQWFQWFMKTYRIQFIPDRMLPVLPSSIEAVTYFESFWSCFSLLFWTWGMAEITVEFTNS